jgi:hypothetical protein
MAYLSLKQQKSIKAENQKRSGYQYIDEVTWTEQDQRIVEEKKNWTVADYNLSDINYRNYF